MVLFLALVLAAVGLGVAGAVVGGLFYLLIIGVVVFVLDLVLTGVRIGRGRRRPAR